MSHDRKMKGVIFDLDGVLLDSMEIWNDLGARYLRKHGRVPEEGLAEILFSMSMEQGAEYLRSNYSLEQTAAEIGQGLSDMLRDFYYYEVLAKPGAKELLESFRKDGLSMVAATSSPRGHVEAALKRTGIFEYLEKIFTSAETGSSKHSPEIYDNAARYMGTTREETFVFEDSLYALKTAADAGYRAVGVFDADGKSDQEEMKKTADIYIKELRDFSY